MWITYTAPAVLRGSGDYTTALITFEEADDLSTTVPTVPSAYDASYYTVTAGDYTLWQSDYVDTPSEVDTGIIFYRW